MGSTRNVATRGSELSPLPIHSIVNVKQSPPRKHAPSIHCDTREFFASVDGAMSTAPEIIGMSNCHSCKIANNACQLSAHDRVNFATSL